MSRFVYVMIPLLFVLLAAARSPAQGVPLASSLALAANGSDSISGDYRLVGGQPTVRRAIDEVCNRLDVFARLFARPILERRNPAYRRVLLDVRSSSARFSYDGWGPNELPLSGETRMLRGEGGEQVTASQQLRGNRLVQVFRTPEGWRRNVIVAHPDGRMTIHTRIESPRLPVPLVYELHYRRVGG